MCTLKLLYSGDERRLWNEMDGWAGSPSSLLPGVCVYVCDGQAGDDSEYVRIIEKSTRPSYK